MPNKVFYLASCSTCKRILNTVDEAEQLLRREIKSEPLTETELAQMRESVDSYEDMLNKRSQRYAALGLKTQSPSEEEWKDLFLTEYTFLKRPVFEIDGVYFFGNAKKTIAAVEAALSVSK